MAARLIRPLYLRYDVRTGKTDVRRSKGASTNAAGAPRARPDPENGTEQGPAPLPRPQPPKNLDDGSIKVLRDDKPGMQARAEQTLRSPATSLDDGSAKVDRAGRIGAEKFEDFFDPPTVKSSDNGSIKVLRGGRAGAKELLNPMIADDIEVLRYDRTADAQVPPPAKNSERVAEIARNDKIMIEELEREQQFRMALAKQASRPKYSDDENISTKTIIQIAAAVIALGLAFAAIMPSLLTRDPVEYTAGVITPAPPAPAQAEPPGVAQPLPGPPPAQAPKAPSPAAASNEATSVVKTAPALRDSAPTDVPADGRANEQVLLPSAGKAAGRTPLTAEETAAVNRGLEALQKSAATKAPLPRSAPNRLALTAEEQAAVERGLRELEKSGQTKQ